MAGWVDRWLDGRVDVRTYGCMYKCKLLGNISGNRTEVLGGGAPANNLADAALLFVLVLVHAVLK